MWASIHAPQTVRQEYVVSKVVLRGVGTAQRTVSKMKLQSVCPDLDKAMISTSKNVSSSLAFPLASSEVLSIIADFVENKSYPKDLSVEDVPSPSRASTLCSTHLSVYIAVQEPSIPILKTTALQEFLHRLPQAIRTDQIPQSISSVINKLFSITGLQDEISSRVLLCILFNFNTVRKSQDIADMFEAKMIGLWDFLIKANAWIAAQSVILEMEKTKNEELERLVHQEASKNTALKSHAEDLKRECKQLQKEMDAVLAASKTVDSKPNAVNHEPGPKISAANVQDVTTKENLMYLKHVLSLYQAAIVDIGKRVDTEADQIVSEAGVEPQIAKDMAILKSAGEKLKSVNTRDAQTQTSGNSPETESTGSRGPRSQLARLLVENAALRNQLDSAVGSASSRRIATLQKQLEDARAAGQSSSKSKDEHVALLQNKHESEVQQMSAQIESLRKELRTSQVSDKTNAAIIVGLRRKMNHQRIQLDHMNRAYARVRGSARPSNQEEASRREAIKVAMDLLKRLG